MIARHPFGAPQTVEIASGGDGVVTVVWRVGAPDDLTLLGIELGVLPADRVLLDGAIEYDASDASTVAESDALPSYVLDHVAVSTAAGACAGKVVEVGDLVEDGAALTFTCAGPVDQVDVEVTTLTDLHPAYRTLATGPEGQRAVYDEAGSVQTWRLPGSRDGRSATASTAEVQLWPDKVVNGNIDLDGDGVTDHRASDQLQFGASFLRLLQFDVERSEVSIDTYSPYFDNFGATEYDTRHRYNGAEDNLTLPVDLETRTTSFATDGLTVVTPTDVVIGEDTARSGWPASVQWDGLVEGEIYAWVADSRDADGEVVRGLRQFGGVFVATAAGTDVTPPEIALPSDDTFEVGEAFDPLAGVTAVDDTDGDVTDRIAVLGSVDTSTAGSYALTYVVSDTNGNQTVVPRAVRVVEPVDTRAVTTVAAANTAVTFGRTLRLKAAVTPASATGTVTFLNGEEELCVGTVVDGVARCATDLLPAPGDYAVNASYSGDAAHQPSSKAFVLVVKPPKKSPNLRAWAADTTVGRTRPAVLKATVAVGATGKVVFVSGGKRLCAAAISAGKAICEVPATQKPGTYDVVATYAGNATFLAAKDRFGYRKLR